MGHQRDESDPGHPGDSLGHGLRRDQSREFDQDVAGAVDGEVAPVGHDGGQRLVHHYLGAAQQLDPVGDMRRQRLEGPVMGFGYSIPCLAGGDMRSQAQMGDALALQLFKHAKRLLNRA
jgi:hypothetical protein